MATSKSDVSVTADHLQKLEALFSGGNQSKTDTTTSSRITSKIKVVPKRQVFSNPRKSLGRAPSEYRLRLERLRMARETEEIVQTTDAFLEHHQLPDDVEILLKVLQHPSEKVLREAMGQLSSLLMQGRLENTILLEDKLQELSKREIEGSTKSYIDGLQHQITRLSN